MTQALKSGGSTVESQDGEEAESDASNLVTDGVEHFEIPVDGEVQEHVVGFGDAVDAVVEDIVAEGAGVEVEADGEDPVAGGVAASFASWVLLSLLFL